jgi:hypothetical protein
MGKPRDFLPPATCSACSERPALGDTLVHTGSVWLCPACLTETSPGTSTTSKAARLAIRAQEERGLSIRARAAGEITEAAEHHDLALWHGQASEAIAGQVPAVTIAHGEAVSQWLPWMRDTLADLDLPALDASRTRGQLLEANDVTALGIDVASTVAAGNTVEKLLAHQVALAHKVAFEQASKAARERDPAIEAKRLESAAKMMAAAQRAAITLQKLRASGPQRVVVQHVHVEAGGQAVVGDVRVGRRREGLERSTQNLTTPMQRSSPPGTDLADSAKI